MPKVFPERDSDEEAAEGPSILGELDRVQTQLNSADAAIDLLEKRLVNALGPDQGYPSEVKNAPSGDDDGHSVGVTRVLRTQEQLDGLIWRIRHLTRRVQV